MADTDKNLEKAVDDHLKRLDGRYAGYWKYGVYYLLSAGLFIYGFRRLQSAVEKYSEKMPAAEPVTQHHDKTKGD